MPEYQGLRVAVEVRAVSEEDVAQALDVLRKQRSRITPMWRVRSTKVTSLS